MIKVLRMLQEMSAAILYETRVQLFDFGKFLFEKCIQIVSRKINSTILLLFTPYKVRIISLQFFCESYTLTIDGEEAFYQNQATSELRYEKGELTNIFKELHLDTYWSL